MKITKGCGLFQALEEWIKYLFPDYTEEQRLLILSKRLVSKHNSVQLDMLAKGMDGLPKSEAAGARELLDDVGKKGKESKKLQKILLIGWPPFAGKFWRLILLAAGCCSQRMKRNAPNPCHG